MEACLFVWGNTIPALMGLHRTPFSPLRCVKVAAEYWLHGLPLRSSNAI